MAFNDELAGLFEEMATLLEVLGENRFRVAAIAKVARVVGDAAEDLSSIAGDVSELEKFEGVGAKTAEMIAEFARTGKIAALDELRQQVPAGLAEVLAIPGLGPKTVALIWKEKGVESLDDLERIIADGSIKDLPRMGQKTIDKLKGSIRFHKAAGDRMLLGRAMPIAEAFVEALSTVPGVKRVRFAGSLRRGKETIGDVDILAACDDPAQAIEAFIGIEGVQEVIARGETKVSVRYAGRKNRMIQVDLRIVDEAAYGAALMYFTGSKEHNVKLRERAIARSMTLNEYGLFREEKAEREAGSPQSRGAVPVAAAEEAEIYAALGLAFVPPELREDRGEVADGYEPPDLIEVGDIKAELHAHTTASDGRMSIEELAQQAIARGFHTLAVTDHSKSSAIAGGLDEARLREHIKQVRKVSRKLTGFTLLTGSEVDILADGTLDYDDDLLAELDVVVASPHASLQQDSKTAMKRMLRAIEHPLVHIIGHPTGRLIGQREGLDLDLHELAAAAAEHRVALEINANWRRLDLRDTHVRIALEKGALIAIDCDVHDASDYDNLRYGVLTGRRGGLTAQRCINTWSGSKLHAWLKAKR